MKNYRFHGGFSLITFAMRDMKMKMTSSCSPRPADSKDVLFDLERSISKSDLRPGQVNVRS